ncbi:MAG: aspartate carbamoyltransferase [Bacteroidota bacterium]|jgi:aspartate carbamoyltransferase catalytic subunit|nr:aspartate carbamoyltransferase [Bacteroidales bacterium]MDI9535773.1 aspartate carbamoyltransferase [Bacteroidota bacterium]OQC45197.1 MAG: Aspartate carbamoyltransferase catalytic chain [Bacteroidetes bacterium ADurb.Bin028]NLP20815.1 aspartate carbamoyltransferase [Bacteroidales bacterium]HNY44033.1 aspartate carbamoyltransferase [Bacteroidales bacterium]
MNKKSLISITDYSKEDIFKILDLAEEFQNNPKHEKLLENFVIASLFFEPSTRTRLSFESAIQKLGGKVVGFSEASNSSVAKGESLKDTILTVSNYSDLIIMRHPIEGSARYACDITSTPIINAGDGANQHPTQCLLDLYSIRKTQGTLENLNLYIVGDLKYGRTVHSLLMAMSDFNPTFNFVSPVQLRIPQEYKNFLNDKGLDFYEHDQLDENIKYADIIYVTRVQRERFSDPVEYEKVKNTYVLKNKMLENTKDNLKVLHPLPRVNEIDTDVDDNPKAYYFQQAENGVYARMALICHILGIK